MKGRGRALIFVWALLPVSLAAQINTDRMMLMGRNALYYEDYVLSIRRFNMVIAAKPYLHEPYFFRGLAKFYLEDYTGAEADCGEAIERNPFLPDNYELRGLCRINLGMYAEAVADYDKLLAIEPNNEVALHNQTLCYLQLKDYEKAVATADRMLALWPRKASLYTLKAQAQMEQADTTAAMSTLDRGLEINPYEGQAWNMKAAVFAKRGEYKAAEDALDKTIVQFPREAGHYVNRALVRYHQRNLRGAMADYDTALEMDTANYVAHFNRGLLRAQVGDDNRAIEDFNFVLRLEPDNMIARFNRALMLENTGDLRGAIRDINAVIAEYPNFWAGYQFRAGVWRKLGDTRAAERDEFKVLKAQMEQRYGGQKATASTKTRKVSDRTMEDYDKLVEADTDDDEAPAYESAYRGKVQNRRTELTPEPDVVLTYHAGGDEFQRREYSSELESLNRTGTLREKLSLCRGEATLSESQVQAYFNSIQELDGKIAAQPTNAWLFFARSMDEYTVQDFEKALADVGRTIELDSMNVFARYLRAQIRTKELDARPASQQTLDIGAATNDLGRGFDVSRKSYRDVLSDYDWVLSRMPDFAGCHYNKGNVYMRMKLWPEAIEAYTRAIGVYADDAAAYYNRGVAYILSGNAAAAIPDLSRAGELGLYKAYNLIKRYRSNPTAANE